MGTDTSLDTSVLINFLRVKRIDLLKASAYSFHITDHVEQEISNHYSEQKELLHFGFEQKIFQRTNTATLEELATFAQIYKERQLGAGECAAIAIAYHRQYYLAIDDKQAIKKATYWIPPQHILRTENLLSEMIHDHILTIEEASHLLEIWAKEHRFKLKLKGTNYA